MNRMIVMKKSNCTSNRYSAELDGYSLTLEIAKKPSGSGISNGRITRLLLYPSNKNQRLEHIYVFNQGWLDSVPYTETVRRVIENAVYYFDALAIDWSKERLRRTNTDLVGSK